MAIHIGRREFIATLGSAAAVWPLVARAQQPAMPVVGFLSGASSAPYAYIVAAFRQGLNEAGHVEGRNVTIEYRWAEGQNDRLPGLVADLVRRQVAIITTTGTPETLAAKAETRKIPIVFQVGTDPADIGLVPSLKRPGGNLTGVFNLNAEVGPKRLELLRELLPTAPVMALLVNPTSPTLAETLSRDVQAAAHILGVQLHRLQASNEREIDDAFAALAQLRASALVIAPDVFFNTRSEQLAALTLRHAMPAIYQFRAFAAAGGLMSYGGDLTDSYRQVGLYTGRILKGANPADLPVHQATKVELIINLKTAKALGLELPPTLLARADEVIE
jgi:putative tryptophan/tyrosine transport system substrate-binding protein